MNSDTSICRVCLLSDSEGFSLLQKTDLHQEYTFLEMFNACTHLEALEVDDFPQFICLNCSNDLQIAFDFLYKATTSDKFLKDQDVKREEQVEFSYSSDEQKEEENSFPYEEETSQTELQVEVRLDQYENDIPSDIFQTTKIKSIVPENNHKLGFDKHFKEFVESAFESVYIEPNKDSNHESDADAFDYDNEEEEENESNHLESQTTSGRKQTVLNHHLKRCQKDEKIHLCSSCPKTFAVRSDLRNHMRIHNTERERKYTCTECGKGFFEKQSLKVHITRHLGDKEYHCKLCPKQFITKKSLSVHEFTHNRELGKFVCKHCDKRFTSKADLIVHERFHTGDYPYQCEYCDKSYAVKSHYNYHLAKHKGITYKCDQCDKEFINRGSLTAHKFKHSERFPHECSICKKGFTSPYKLNRHKSSHKPKEDDDRIK